MTKQQYSTYKNMVNNNHLILSNNKYCLIALTVLEEDICYQPFNLLIHTQKSKTHAYTQREKRHTYVRERDKRDTLDTRTSPHTPRKHNTPHGCTHANKQ